MALAADVMRFAARVEAIKVIDGQRHAIVIRGTPAVLGRAAPDGAWHVLRPADTVEDWLQPFRACP
jgi:hypothetical protein